MSNNNLPTMRQIVSAAILRQPALVERDGRNEQYDMRKRCADVAMLTLMPLEEDEVG